MARSSTEVFLAKPTFSGGDVRVAAGLAGNALAAMLWSKKLLSDDDALTIITGAIEMLGEMGAHQPHPAWVAAQNLLRMQATRFGGPTPGAKPS
jgi:hypothetical protein